MSNSVAVDVIDLAREYRRGKIPIPALNGINLKIRKAEIVGIVGPSGSGKTTLLNLIGGLDRPTKGKVVVDNQDLNELSDKDLSSYRLKKIGFIFQFYNLISTLSAKENVEIPMSLAKAPVKERERRALELLKDVGLESRVSHMPDELSGGEQQRVAVARALANDPPVILADEPTGDLDSKSAQALMETINSLRNEKHVTFVLVTHDPIVVGRCDRAYAVRDGRVTHELSREELDAARLSDKYDRTAMDGIY
jgi:putative ABC transport system ATP-binding protein